MKKIIILLLIILGFHFTNAQETWLQKTNFGGTTRYRSTGFSIGTKGYILTGYDLVTPETVDLWEWDQQTNLWTQKTSFPGQRREGAVAFSIGTKGYIGTGLSSFAGGDSCKKDFWEWDQATDTWSQKAYFGGHERLSAVGFSIGTKGYIGTGQDLEAPSNYYNDFWEWDQATNIWTQKTDLPASIRATAVGFSIDSMGYVGLGSQYSFTKKDFWQFDPMNNSWLQKADFGGTKRGSAVGFSIGSKGYVGTGYDGSSTNYQDFWEWDKANNSWVQKLTFAGSARRAAVAFAIGSKGYIGTGYSTDFTNDFWEYTPFNVGITESNNDSKILFFPNPLIESSKIFFVADIIEPCTQLTILNSLSQIVYRTTISTNHQSIMRENLSAGIYFWNITNKNKESISKGKLIIE